MPFWYSCQTCGNAIKKTTVSRTKAQFCNNACKFESYRTRPRTRECAACHRPYRLDPGLSKAGLAKSRFCSHRCQMRVRHAPIEERFWKQVRKTYSCWNWTGHSMDGRYGVIYYDGRQRPAHRYAWEREHEEAIPSGIFVLHRCDNPRCVRIDHLFLGTQSDNMKDMHIKGRHPRNKKKRREPSVEDSRLA